MASLSSTITVEQKLRPCVVKNKFNALFHQWIERAEVVPPAVAIGGHAGGQIRATFGLVEYEDGSISEVYPTSIRFIDDKTNDYCFCDNGKATLWQSNSANKPGTDGGKR